MALQAPRSETGTGPQSSSGAYVKVRVSGDTPGVARALRVLRDASETGGFEIAEESRPYPNHREPGFRVYVTLRFPVPDGPDPAGRPA
jgi:hypothetical protein